MLILIQIRLRQKLLKGIENLSLPHCSHLNWVKTPNDKVGNKARKFIKLIQEWIHDIKLFLTAVKYMV